MRPPNASWCPQPTPLRRALLLVLICLFSTVCLAQDFRTWTDRQGETIRAKFVRLVDDRVMLSTRTRAINIPLSELSDSDQQLAKALDEAKEYRTWSTSGKQFQGKYVRYVNGTVEIFSGGRVRNVRLAELDRDSQEFVRRQIQASNGAAGSGPDLGRPARTGLRRRDEASASDDPVDEFLGRSGTSVTGEAERTWTDSRGKSIQATLLHLDGDIVTIEKDSRTFDLPLSRLSQDDQLYVNLVRIRLEADATLEANPEEASWDTLQDHVKEIFEDTQAASPGAATPPQDLISTDRGRPRPREPPTERPDWDRERADAGYEPNEFQPRPSGSSTRPYAHDAAESPDDLQMTADEYGDVEIPATPVALLLITLQMSANVACLICFIIALVRIFPENTTVGVLSLLLACIGIGGLIALIYSLMKFPDKLTAFWLVSIIASIALSVIQVVMYSGLL